LVWPALLDRHPEGTVFPQTGKSRDQSVPCLLYADELDKQMNNPPVLAVQDRWLSVQELSDYLGIKRDTVYKWILRRNMPAHKAGRLWKFRKDEIDEWVRSGAASERDN
jgi:excisionase family DNA binding protein